MIRVFFDGKCLFCIRIKKFVEKVDLRNQIGFFDLWQSKQLLEERGVKERDFTKEIHLLTESGDVCKGYFAVKYILLNLFILRFIGKFFDAFFPDRLGILIYSYISRNRFKFARCESCLLQR